MSWAVYQLLALSLLPSAPLLRERSGVFVLNEEFICSFSLMFTVGFFLLHTLCKVNISSSEQSVRKKSMCVVVWKRIRQVILFHQEQKKNMLISCKAQKSRKKENDLITSQIRNGKHRTHTENKYILVDRWFFFQCPGLIRFKSF